MSVEEFRNRAEKLLADMGLLENEARKAGGSGGAATIRTYSNIRSLISEMKEIENKAVEMEKADIATRIKFSRKAKKTAKAFWRLVREINAMHAKGEMGEEEAKRFGAILEKVKGKKVPEAERDLEPFKRMESLATRMGEVNEKLGNLAEEIDSRLAYLEAQLESARVAENLSELEKQAGRYREIEAVLRRYGEWRKVHIMRLRGMPLSKVIGACSTGELFALGFPRPKDEFSLDELGDFLVSAKVGGSAAEVLGMADLELGKLKAIVGDHHQFLRLVNENSEWLEMVAGLERSDFLAFDFGNGERKGLIAKALSASKETVLEGEMRELYKIGRLEFEGLRHAAGKVDEARKGKKIDEGAIKSEAVELGGIRGRLQVESGE